MAGDDPFAFLGTATATATATAPPEIQKAFKKPNWRGKLKQFSKDREARSVHEAEKQLDDFLGPARARPLPEAPSLSRIDHVLPPQSSSGPSVMSKSLSADNIASTHPGIRILSPNNRRRRKSLRVKFSDGAPEVMGEGGDECEEPTVEIALNRKRAPVEVDDQPEAQDTNQRRGMLPELRIDTICQNDHAETAKKEKNTGRKPLLISPQDQDFLMALNVGENGSRLSLRASADSNSFAKRIQARMQAEEGRALQHRLEDPISPTKADESQPQLQPPQQTLPLRPSLAFQQSYASSQRSLGVESNDTANASLHTSPVPAVQEQIAALRREPTLPDVLSPTESSHSLSPPSGERRPSIPSAEVLPRPVSREKPRPPEVDSVAPPRAGPRTTIRSIANTVSDNAFLDFTNYVERYSSLFQLAAERDKPLMETSFAEWIRAATWWFLKGRSSLEAVVRSNRTGDASGMLSPQTSSSAEQAIIDLGKAWWISKHIIPQHSELTRYGRISVEAVMGVMNTTGNQRLAGLVNLQQKILNHLRALTVSMKRNHVLNAVMMNADAVDRSPDTNIWVRYPFFAPDVSAILSGANPKSMLIDPAAQLASTPDLMLLGDTSRFFGYGTMFVDVSVSLGDDDSQYPVPCVLSIMRDRADWYVMAAIASQSELLNITIQADRNAGPTWDDVDWQVRTCTMRVKLHRGFELDIAFQDKDFKVIWNIVKYTLKTEASMAPEASETVVFEDTLKVFQYMDPGTPKAFPPEPSQRCRIRLFERFTTVTEGTGSRKTHRGFRLTVVTSPKVKTLSSVRHTLGHGAPIVFGYLRGEDGAPALLLNVKEEGRNRSMVLTFHELQQRTTMHSLLVGILAGDTEFTIPDILIRSFAIEQPGDPNTGTAAVTHVQFSAGAVSVIDQQPAYINHGYGAQMLSEHLRALVSTDWGTVTDRINLGPGEMKIGLDVNKDTVLYMLRSSQEDLTVSVAENLVRKELADRLTEFLQTAKSKAMIRRYEFVSLQALHQFERAVTGFNVLFDGITATFAISRRRMVVPIHKKWEASGARIQVVQQNKTIQLLAFFGCDFSHGKCMNFVLKGMDTYESFTRSGKIGIRIVDAKFALPKTEDDESGRFVCLDLPEYPSEHDDINILFETESARRDFLAALPGSLKEPSRMGSLRR